MSARYVLTESGMELMDHERKYLAGELLSLGVSPNKLNKLNDSKELEELVEFLKQNLYQEYKTAYSP
jgi:hypothetical protein